MVKGRETSDIEFDINPIMDVIESVASPSISARKNDMDSNGLIKSE